MTVPTDVAIPVPVHFDGHNINIITEVNFPSAPTQVKQSQTSANKDRQSLYKTEVCREWSTSGWCYYGKRCSFAHGLNELRPVFRCKKWRTKRCRNWQSTGYCPYEHRCQFLHDQSPPRRTFDEDAKGQTAGGEQQTTTDGNGMDGGVDGKELYFHFDLRQGDAEEDESEAGRDGSENHVSPDNNNRRADNPREILNEIGNLSGEGVQRWMPPSAAANDRSMNTVNQQGASRVKPKGTIPGGPNSPSANGGLNNLAQQQQQQQQQQLPSSMNFVQAHQILSNQTAATQLAAQFASLSLSSHQQATQHQPYFGDAGARMTPTQTQFAEAMARVQSDVTSPPPVDLSGLAGTPSIPMGTSRTPTGTAPASNGGGGGGGSSDANIESSAALLSAMYSMGPGLDGLFHAARLGQLPQNELEQLCNGFASTSGAVAGNGNLTAPVPFSRPMTPGTVAGAPTLVFDNSVVGTPSGSVEPPGYDHAFYTPSPPPSLLGVDSVSNLGFRFVPQDSPAPPFGLPYQAGMGLDRSNQFLVPNCSTPGLPFSNANAPNLFARPMTPVGTPPMTPTGMFAPATFPQYFGTPQPTAFGGMPPREASGMPTTGSGLAGDPNNIVLFGGPPPPSYPGVMPLDGVSRRT